LEQHAYKETQTHYIYNEKPQVFDERVTLDFLSQYGCLKRSANQSTLDYARIFRLKIIAFFPPVINVYSSRHNLQLITKVV
jgi:nucleoside-diphosphate-sugar epimerase